jgi:hypothetical protein
MLWFFTSQEEIAYSEFNEDGEQVFALFKT